MIELKIIVKVMRSQGFIPYSLQMLAVKTCKSTGGIFLIFQILQSYGGVIMPFEKILEG